VPSNPVPSAEAVCPTCAVARTSLKHVPKGEGRPLAAIEILYPGRVELLTWLDT